MLRQLPLFDHQLESVDENRNLQNEALYEDLFLSNEDHMEEEFELEPILRSPRRAMSSHRQRVEYMDYDEPDIFMEIEAQMNDMNNMRERMDMVMRRFHIPHMHHEIHLDIPSISRDKHKKFMGGRMTREERRLKDEYNAGMIKGAKENDLASVKHFVQRGAGIFYSDDEGWTALHISASKGFTEVADFLISEGLYRDCTTRKGETPLMLAARSNHISTVKCLLRNQASVDMRDKQGRTSLMYAAEGAGKEILQMLTDNKGDINATDKAGNTAVIWATMNKNDAAVDFLVKQFCELDLEKKSKEKNWTALHWAVSTESVTNIRALVKAGAAMNAGHFNKGETPVKLAYRLGNREILHLMHDLEATSHRRVAYCSDGEELKYRCFLLGPRLEGDQPGPPLPDLSPEMLSLYQAIQEELWKHEDIEIAYPPGETEDSQSPESENSASPSTETGPRDMGIAASSTDGGVQDCSTGVKSKTKRVSTASKRRKQVKERRRLIRRKLDPLMASWADGIRDAAENSAIKDEVYPPPLKIQIHVFTLIFLSLKTENVHVQNMSYVQVLETNSVPPENKPHRRG